MNIALIFTGLISGIFGGMGMGGGTLLIPALRVFFDVDQQLAQAVNLVSFIPMAVVAVIIHCKNKLVEIKGVWIIILTGLIFCAFGAYLAEITDGEILKKAFGGFLLLLSAIRLASTFRKKN